jgi:hypothetical protein
VIPQGVDKLTLSEYQDDHEFTEAEAAAILRGSIRDLLAKRRRDKEIGFKRYGRYEIRYTAKHLRDYRATKEIKALCQEDRPQRPPRKAPASVKSATGGSKSQTAPRIGIESGMTQGHVKPSSTRRGAKIFAALTSI